MNFSRFAVAAALTVPLAAHATTINFDAAPQNSIFGPEYSEAGYTLTGSGFEFPQFGGFAYTTFANDGTLTLNYKGPTYTLTKDGGGKFNFTSFDLGNVNGDTFGGTLLVSYNGGAAVIYAIPTTGTMKSYGAAGSRVTSVSFSYLPGETANNTLNSYARLDNLSVSGAGAVPEPAEWVMLLIGFGLVGGLVRHRGRTTSRTI